jgi:osmotically-inducible protein OsmY
LTLLRDTRLRDTRDTTFVRKADQPRALGGAGVNKPTRMAWTADQAITDRWITAKVKTHFVGPTLLPDVTVETRDHVVTLKGHVPSRAEREHAAGLARSTEGVTQVVNQLEVRQE